MTKVKSIRETYGETLVELGNINKDVVVLDADASNSTRTVLFAEKFPERFYNIGIAESNMVSIAAGLASEGLIPFTNTFSFLLTLRAGDAVRSLVAYNNLNVKLAGAYSGLSDSYDGGSHQSVMDIAVMRSMPNMTVISVSDPVQTRWAVKEIAHNKGPVYLRLSRAEFPFIYEDKTDFEIGKGKIVRNGNDITIIATGYMVYKACLAAEELEKQIGISVRVIDMHTIKPIDREIIIKAAKETKGILTVEEHSIYGGLGSGVAEVVVNNFPVNMACIGIEDKFGESGPYEELLSEFGLDIHNIKQQTINLLKKQKKERNYK